MKMPCGYEGPRGGSCNGEGKWRVSAGDFNSGPHASSYSCDHHLPDVRAWVFTSTGLMPRTDPLTGPVRDPRLHLFA